MATDIAIVGIAFKGPQDAATETGLWDVLEKRKNLMTEWPASRVNLGAFYDASREKFNMVRYQDEQTSTFVKSETKVGRLFVC